MARRRTAAAPLAPSAPCPCGRAATYGACCGRLHRGEAAATTAEQLMRSRYSAYAVRNESYLLASWHPATRPARVGFESDLRWERLEVLNTTDGTAFNTAGTVEFRAHYTQGGRAHELHEVSRFVQHGGRWVYLDGDEG